MVEKIKLGVWDFFAYVLSGTAVIISVLIHFICKGIIKIDDLGKIPVAISTIILLLGLFLIGLLLEPVANISDKFLNLMKAFLKIKYWDKKVRTKFLTEFKQALTEIGFIKWDENNKKLMESAKGQINKNIHESTFQYCKNWVIQHGNAEQLQSSLGKYGFYRNLSLIALGNSITSLLIYPLCCNGIIIVVVLFLLAFLYLYRSGIFYRHMGITVYSQFLAAHDKDSKV